MRTRGWGRQEETGEARGCVFTSPLTLKYSGEGDRGGIRPPSKQVEDLQSEAEGV